MLDNRPIAMISSTARDLPEHREEVRQACERTGFAPREMMENLPALNKDAVETSLEMVDRAAVYIGIFAYRYGTVPEGADESITEMELNRAEKKEIPRLLFVIHDDHPVKGSEVEKGRGAEKLDALKERVQRPSGGRVTDDFKSSKDLRAKVVEALGALQQGNDVDASTSLHRRSSIPTPPKADIVHPYTLSETQALIGRQKELNALTDWVDESKPAFRNARIFCLVAIGGMGKSALAWKWFQEIAPKEMPDLEGRLWWSFYESDAGFENFLGRALGYVSGLPEDDIRKMAWQEKEGLLLRHLDEKPFLLGLDGLERVLIAYCRMDASHLADDDLDQETANRVAGAYGLPETAGKSFIGRHKLRQTVDPRAGRFLQKLTTVRASRILVSTRLFPSDLQIRSGASRPGCIAYFLPGLTDDDALDLWRALGVSGKRAELLPLFDSFKRHPLLLQALAGEVANFRGKPGDLAAWKAGHADFAPTDLPLEQRRSHILQFALMGLQGPAREVLHTITGFRMPVQYQTLEALLISEDKTCADAMALDKALSELEDRGLIGWDREANRYDAHPIVRGVVWRLAGDKARNTVHAAIDAHFEPIANGVAYWLEINSVDNIAPAIELYHTLVSVRRFDEAFSLFKSRLDESTLFRLSAHRERIACLERLFPKGIEHFPALTSPSASSLAINALAVSYQYSGRPGEASELFERAISLHCGEAHDKPNLRIILQDFAEALPDIGSLRAAAGKAYQALVLSKELDDRHGEATSLAELGRVSLIAGRSKPDLFGLARSIRIFRKLGQDQCEGTIAASLADLEFWQGDFSTAERWAKRASSLADTLRVERDFIRVALLLGRAALNRGDHEQADKQLHEALIRTRVANLVDLELQALAAIAELDLRLSNLEEATNLLANSWEPAEEGPYPLRLADACNVLADICLAEDDRSGAIEAATEAYKAAWCDGPPWAYHWGLEKAKAHLQALGAPEPDMPPFDESKYEPMPEVEINPKDDHWVDPSVPLEALLDLDTDG